MSLERIAAKILECKDTGPGSFVAVASTPAIDHDGESLAVGCFSPLPLSIPVHVDHDLRVESIVGRAKPRYSGSQLLIDAVFASSPKAQMVRGLIKEGMVTDVSVVFVDAQRKHINGVQTVVKGTLKACDLVSVACNPQAQLVSARSIDNQLAFMALKAQILTAQIEAEEALAGADDVEFRRALSDSRAFLEALRRPST